MDKACPQCNTENTAASKFCDECAAPLHEAEDFAGSFTKTLQVPPGKLSKDILFADRYEMLAQLGKGGMGEVYKVRDTKLDEEVALKLLRKEIAADQDVILRFRNELKLARRITHKNVCRVFDFHEEGDIPFITMEYVPGEDLRSLIQRRGRLPIDETLRILTQIVEGLAEAHKLGVVHRDLKPQNIMIHKSGRAKIMDFGIARSIELPGTTQTGIMIGTPDYISPEQAAGEPADQRSDIYSLGVMLFEMVVGNYDTALEEVQKALDAGFADNFWGNLIIGAVFQAMGNLDEAEEEYLKMIPGQFPLSEITGRDCMGWLHLLKGNYHQALNQFEMALKIDEEVGEAPLLARHHAALAYISLQTGDFERALDECDLSIQTIGPMDDAHAARRHALHLKGLAYLKMEDVKRAQDTVESLKALAEQVYSKKAKREHLHLLGLIEMNKENYSGALVYLKDAMSLLPSQMQDDLRGFNLSLRRVLFIDSLAFAYFRSSDLENAKDTYQALTSLTIGRHHCADLYAKAFYMLGRIYEQQGNRIQAIENYERFLSLWKDADPGITEVEDARKRQAGLLGK